MLHQLVTELGSDIQYICMRFTIYCTPCISYTVGHNTCTFKFNSKPLLCMYLRTYVYTVCMYVCVCDSTDFKCCLIYKSRWRVHIAASCVRDATHTCIYLPHGQGYLPVVMYMRIYSMHNALCVNHERMKHHTNTLLAWHQLVSFGSEGY